MKHSPEPWHVDHGNIVAADTENVFGGYEWEWRFEDVGVPRDARRIVACVNACAEFSTEDLENPATKLTLVNKI